MQHVIDLEHYPLDQPGTPAWQSLVQKCQNDLRRDGMFNLAGFVRPEAISQMVAEVAPLLRTESFVHARRHNIYFRKEIDGLAPDHPALQEFDTSNQTICADQMTQALVIWLYEWAPFAAFLAAVMGKARLYTMPDPLARVNVMSYRDGQALNWHFDRSEFTTTLLLQAPREGSVFEYERDLRRDDEPNYEGVADLVQGRRTPARLVLDPGTLNVFRGKNTAHRVTPAIGEVERIIAVFSYYETPGVMFSDEERIGFFGRAS